MLCHHDPESMPPMPPLASIDFELTDESRVLRPQASGADILDAGFLYGNGFFRCELAVACRQDVPSVTIAVEALDESGNAEYQGRADSGFLMNLASLRALI
jgi:hypothetical protein